VRSAETAALASPPAPNAGHAVAIVGGALLRIAEYLVGFGDELELLLGRLVAVVASRWHSIAQLAVGLLDVGFARVAWTPRTT
jgi:hypothetical protein